MTFLQSQKGFLSDLLRTLFIFISPSSCWGLLAWVPNSPIIIQSKIKGKQSQNFIFINAVRSSLNKGQCCWWWSRDWLWHTDICPRAGGLRTVSECKLVQHQPSSIIKHRLTRNTRGLDECFLKLCSISYSLKGVIKFKKIKSRMGSFLVYHGVIHLVYSFLTCDSDCLLTVAS